VIYKYLKWKCILIILVFSFIVKGAENFQQCAYNPRISSVIDGRESISQWSRNNSLYISPYKLNIKKEMYTVIDVRSKTQYKNYHIKNSYNIPKFKLTTSTIFKGKNVVLVGKGNDYRYLEDLLKKLLEKNYKTVSILDGGIDFWKSKIAGLRPSLDEYNISSLDVLLKEDNSNWIIIDSTKNPKLNKYFNHILSIDNDKLMNPVAFSNSLFANGQMINNILLVLNKNNDFERLHNLWTESLGHNIYMIEVGKLLVATNSLIKKQRAVTYKKRADGAKMTCLM